MGIDLDEEDESRVCPCCDNIIDKEPIPLLCDEDDLLYLGVGYALFYKLARHSAIVLGMILLICGSGFYFLISSNCKSNCIYFLGITIINLEISGKQSVKTAAFTNIITAFILFALVMYIRRKINDDICYLEEKKVCPEQYTIMIQNLPEDINEEELTDWSKETFGVKPILINFAFNITAVSEAFKKR